MPKRIIKDPLGYRPNIIVYENKCRICGAEIESVEDFDICTQCEFRELNERKRILVN